MANFSDEISENSFEDEGFFEEVWPDPPGSPNISDEITENWPEEVGQSFAGALSMSALSFDNRESLRRMLEKLIDSKLENSSFSFSRNVDWRPIRFFFLSNTVSMEEVSRKILFYY